MTSLGAAAARPVPSGSRPGDLVWADRAWWVALTGLCGVLLVPMLVVDVPPLLDYPNHLARAFVLASLPQDTILARFYAPHWSIIPNLAFDLVAPKLIHWLPVHVAGRLLIAAAVLLPVLGAVAYNTGLGGRWWSLGVGLVAYNNCLLLGFLNFAISLGLALLLAAAWLRWREDKPWRAVTLAIIGALALFACHLMGLVFFGLLIGGADLSRLYRAGRGDILRTAVARGMVLVLIFAAPAALYAISALQPLGGDAAFLPFGEKLFQLATIFVNYAWPLDMTAAGIAFAVPLMCVLRRWVNGSDTAGAKVSGVQPAEGRGDGPGPAAFATTLLLIAFLAAPHAWKGTYLLDTRFAVMLGLMLFAGFVPSAEPPALRHVVAVMLVSLFVARMALLTMVWADHRIDLADLRRVLQPVQPGQAVFVAEVGIQEGPAYWKANPHWRALSDGTRVDEHLGALALIEHRAYWPFQFDNPSQQPIETREPYRALAEQVDHIPSWTEAAIADVCGFDYVLLMEADALPDLPAGRFRLLVRSGFAALYSIVHCNGES